MKHLNIFEEFSNEIKSKDDLYLLLADFIEEDGCKIEINKIRDEDYYYCIDVDRSSKEFYYDIVERLTDHGLYVIYSRKKFWTNSNLKSREGIIYTSSSKKSILTHFKAINYSTNKDWEFEIGI